MRDNVSRLGENLGQLKEIFLSFFPKNKIEIRILFICILFYSTYSLILALNTSIIDYKDLLYDVYFSFDNPIIYRQGYVYLEGHPLMVFMTMPFITIGNILAGILGYKAKTVFLTLLCTLLISFSVIYIYRYLTQILELKGNIVYLLLVFFAFTSTNLTLAFTLESFTITTFFLSFTLYFYSSYIKQNKDIRLSSNIFFAVILGGITITNFAKGIIPILFTNDSKKSIIKKIVIVSVVFAIIIIWMQVQYDFISLIKNRLGGNISVPARGNYFERVFEWLFAAPLFFPDIMMLDIKIDGMLFKAISLDFYHHWWQYIFPIGILICLGYSIFKNYKNPLVLIIIFLLLEDIVIHGLIRYGLRDAFIYGGHWVFLVPILLGWLYKSIREEKNRKNLSFVLSVLTIMLIANNILHLVNFMQLSLDNFPPY